MRSLHPTQAEPELRGCSAVRRRRVQRVLRKRPGVTEGCMHVFISADRGWGAADITLGYSQWHRDTNCGFNLLLRLELTPLHLAAAISTCDILTISLKSLVLPCLNFLFSTSLELTQSGAAIRYSNTFIFCLRSPCLTLSLLSGVFNKLFLAKNMSRGSALWWWEGAKDSL